MSGFEHLVHGFATIIVSPDLLLICLIGVLLGTLVGVLPGIGPTVTMALMLPLTLKYGPQAGIIMMAGIWYGSMYGGSTTSILVNIPGEAASVVTCLDGYQMARRGRAGPALAIVAVGSLIAGTLGNIGLQFLAPPLGQAALKFGPPEYLALMIFAFIVLSNLTGSSPSKNFLMVALGLWLGVIGMDPVEGTPRFTFGLFNLMSGIDFLAVAMGFFGITEILSIAAKKYVPKTTKKIKLRELYPNADEMKRSVAPILRGSILGFFVGLLPGPSPTISTFLSYSVEKRLSITPQKFGTGMIEGVAGPEAANNSAVTGALIPLLALGIPFAPPAAVLLAGLKMHNVNPGPLLFQQAPDLFWTFIASMYIGNVMLLVLNLPFVPIFARIATIKPKTLIPFIGIFCLVGAYSIRNSIFDVWVMLAFGLLGFFLRRFGFQVAPIVIGLVLGPIAENSFRQTSMMFRGDFSLLFSRPIAVCLLLLVVAFLIFVNYKKVRLSKAIGSEESDDY